MVFLEEINEHRLGLQNLPIFHHWLSTGQISLIWASFILTVSRLAAPRFAFQLNFNERLDELLKRHNDNITQWAIWKAVIVFHKLNEVNFNL